VTGTRAGSSGTAGGGNRNVGQELVRQEHGLGARPAQAQEEGAHRHRPTGMTAVVIWEAQPEEGRVGPGQP
jgi:hypothetical protein